jgi:hypothetical protein
VFVAEEWVDKVFEVQRVSDRIIMLKLIVGQRVITILSVYAPQCGLSDAIKDQFYDQLHAMAIKIPATDFLIPCGDWNGHVGSSSTSFRVVHGGHGYGKPEPNVEGERILEFALANDLILGNTCFKKPDKHLITYRSGDAATQIDFILFRKSMRNLVLDVKVIPGEEIALQHQLLVCDINLQVPPRRKHQTAPRLKLWKLKNASTSASFHEAFNMHVSASAYDPDATSDVIWSTLKEG